MNVTGKKLSAILVLLVFVGLAAAPASAKFPKIGKKGGGCTPFQDNGAWQGYLHTDKGQDCALPEPIEKLSDREWMFLRFTDYRGPRPRLAIMPADNRSGYHDVPVDGLEDLLGTILFNTQRFVLVERQQLRSTLSEQDLRLSGRVAEPTAAAVGKVQGAEYLIFAAIVEWMPEKSKIGGGGGKQRRWYRKGTSGSVNRSQAEVAMSFRVVDAATSTVLHTMTTRATAKSWGLGAGLFGKIGGGFGDFGFSKSAPISYAVQAAMAKATYELAEFLTQRPWRGSVMEVIDNIVMINAGSDQGIERNMMMTVLHKGRELIDPETGQSRGSRTEVIGTARVTAVEPSFSEAAILDGCEGVKRGDRVEILSDAPAGRSRSARLQGSSPSPEESPHGGTQAIETTPPDGGS